METSDDSRESVQSPVPSVDYAIQESVGASELPGGQRESKLENNRVLWVAEQTLQENNKHRTASTDIANAAKRQLAGLLVVRESCPSLLTECPDGEFKCEGRKPLCASRSWSTREERSFVRFVSRVKSWSSPRIDFGLGPKSRTRARGSDCIKDVKSISRSAQCGGFVGERSSDNHSNDFDSCDENVVFSRFDLRYGEKSGLRGGCKLTTSTPTSDRLKLRVSPGNRNAVLDLRMESEEDSPVIVGYPRFSEFPTTPVRVGTPTNSTGGRSPEQVLQVHGSKHVNQRMEFPLAYFCCAHEAPELIGVKRTAANAPTQDPHGGRCSEDSHRKGKRSTMEVSLPMSNGACGERKEAGVSQDLDSARNKRNQSFESGSDSVSVVVASGLRRGNLATAPCQGPVRLQSCSVPIIGIPSRAVDQGGIRLQNEERQRGSYDQRRDSAADLPIGVWGNPDFGTFQGLRGKEFDPVTWPGRWKSFSRRSISSVTDSGYGLDGRDSQCIQVGPQGLRTAAFGSLSISNFHRRSVSLSCPLPDRLSVNPNDAKTRTAEGQTRSIVRNLLAKLFRCRCRARGVQFSTIGGDEVVRRFVVNASVEGEACTRTLSSRSAGYIRRHKFMMNMIEESRLE